MPVPPVCSTSILLNLKELKVLYRLDINHTLHPIVDEAEGNLYK